MHEFYFRNIARRWQREIAKANGPVLVFSPYLTSLTAETVLKGVASDRCVIYTRFDAEDFASGGSSLHTLRHLCEKGCTVYAVPNLHAKVVIVPGKFASVGSQNLTLGGTRNREASAIFTQPIEVGHIEKLAESLSSSKRLITLEMIADLEQRLPPITRLFRHARKAARALHAQAEAEEKAKRLRQFQTDLDRLTARSEVVEARVTSLPPRFRFEDFDPTYPPTTLLASRQLTYWEVGEPLFRTYRFLCAEKDSGRIGWARVMKTRITFVENEITGLPVKLAEWPCKMDVKALWKAEDEKISNLEIKIAPNHAAGKLTIRTWFTINTLSNISITAPLAANRELAIVRTWINAHQAEFEQAILAQITRPFHYEQKLSGDEADTFFGPIGTKYELSVRLLGKYPIMEAKRV